MLLDHALDLADQLGMAAEGEIGGEAILDRGETQLRQASDVRLGKALEREVVEWGTAPECERFVQHVGRLLVPSCRQCGPGGCYAGLERVEVKLPRRDGGEIAGRARDEDPVRCAGAGCRLERLAQLGDVDL